MTHDMHEVLRNLVSEQIDAEKEALEEAYFKFFETPEQAFKKLGLYKLEMEEAAISSVDFDSDNLKYRVSTEYRFVLKTVEELAHDRAEEILRRNAPIGTCIVCEEYIYSADKTTSEQTIHGWYHHDCMDGRLDPRSV